MAAGNGYIQYLLHLVAAQGALASVYMDPNDPDGFFSGYVECVGPRHFLMADVTPWGRLEGWRVLRTGEAVHLVIRDGQDIVYIYKTESGPMRMSSRVGLRSPLYCTGVGKAILATLPADEVAQIWQHTTPQKLTAHTIVEYDALQAQLTEVRTNGYAIDDEENELGVRCVAVAIPGVGGRADSAFSISGLAPYMTTERIRRIATLALDARTDIMADLGLAKRI